MQRIFKIFSNLKFSTKILILSTNFIVFILIIGILGGGSVWKVNNTLKQLNNERLIPIYELEEAQSNIRDIRITAESIYHNLRSTRTCDT